eukprot:2519887-Rhodomonas_salina.1
MPNPTPQMLREIEYTGRAKMSRCGVRARAELGEERARAQYTSSPSSQPQFRPLASLSRTSSFLPGLSQPR